METKKVFVGSCQHDIDEEWFNSDDSSYLVLDESSGVCVTVTTCRQCKDDNVASGRAVDPDDVPVDDFVNPFTDDPAPDIMKVVNLDGTTTVIDMSDTDEDEDVSEGIFSRRLN